MRVLYTCGYTENVMKRAGFEDGLRLLAEPFLPADLLRKVNQVLVTRASDDGLARGGARGRPYGRIDTRRRNTLVTIA